MKDAATGNWSAPRTLAGTSAVLRIGADLGRSADGARLERLLEGFAKLRRATPQVHLSLAWARQTSDAFSVQNWIETQGLAEAIDIHPYLDLCRSFPVRKRDCAHWIGPATPDADFAASALAGALARDRRPTALFVTSFDPGRAEGNSALMRHWLNHLRGAGYRIHVLHYRWEQPRRAGPSFDWPCDVLEVVEVRSGLVGSNRNGLNVHVDDWCGVECVRAAGEMARREAFDVAIVNYPFMSAVFEALPAYTHKILLTHDRFTDRNRRLLADGMPESGWISLDRAGERLACLRSDTVVALQDAEAKHFEELVAGAREVRVIGPVPQARPLPPRPGTDRLRVGYLGSSNWVNEYNLVAFLEIWADSPALSARAELVLGGGICESLARFAPAGLLARIGPRMLGQPRDLAEFFRAVDVFVNPERGGTGIKIKTLDALAHGVPVIATAAGMVGIGSTSRFHAAADPAGLAALLTEVVDIPGLREELRRDSAAAWWAYAARHRGALAALLGEAGSASGMTRGLPPPRLPADAAPIVPDYVRRTAADYHLEEFRRVWERFDLTGKRVLEVGSDFHLASARLFRANGAAEVVATNLGHWISDEPLPEGIRFVCGDVADVAETELAPGSFDIVYGIAVLEHIPDLDRVARAVARMLAPGGFAYFQGCPLWPGALGHHVWLGPEALGGEDPAAVNGRRSGAEVVYSFAEPAKNPIPHWAHLNRTPEELRSFLIGRGVPADHAERIADFVYNGGGRHTGICSNFRAASEVVAAFQAHLSVLPEPIVFADPDSAEFRAARSRYAESDLTALGLRLWATLAEAAGGLAWLQPPTVSVIVPFHGVEPWIGACIDSVLAQEFRDFEMILVDDASPDGSRAVVESRAARDPRLRIVAHSENLGLGAARNTGVAHSRGHYLLFLDSDDMLADPSALGTLVATARRTGAEVVAGSAERLMPDGRRAPFDREHDARQGGRPGEALSGRAAFRAAMYVPGGGYLPMRAWGTLIDAAFYRRLDHGFPTGEHEDLGHTPILYEKANRVFYAPEICTLYRVRPGGLSRGAWCAGKLARYAALWSATRTALERHGLAEEIPDAAVKFAEHLVWKSVESGLALGAEPAFVDTLGRLMQDAKGARNAALGRALHSALSWLGRHDPATAAQARARLLPALAGSFLEHLRDRLVALGGKLPPLAAAPVGTGNAGPAVEPSAPSAAFAANEARAAAIIADYEALASAQARRLPAMLTVADRAIYFHAARHFGNRGSIVDAGCFVGGTTINLVEGLRHNPRFADLAEKAGLIRVYDLFRIDDDYIREHLEANYPGQSFATGESFLPVFQRNLANHAALLDVRPGDVTALGYPDPEPIEVFGVDLCKALPVTDHVVRVFFPRLLPGALVLQQDHVHEFHPHIHLSMLRLAEHFDTEVEFRWGGTVAFRLRRPIGADDIAAAFGRDDRWYGEVATNTALLRSLIDAAHYDENRWVYLLTLAIYLADQGQMRAARDAFAEAGERYPAFRPTLAARRRVFGDAD